MAPVVKKRSLGRKILIGLVIFVILCAAAFHLYITRYLPPLVKRRLTEVIVTGSDSLYKFEMGKFDLGFWGGSARFTDLHITIDSTVYKRMKEAHKLPPMTCEIHLSKGQINEIGMRAMIFSHKIDIGEILFDSADVKLARHFKTTEDDVDNGQPLWKLIQPRIRSISIGAIYCAGLKINYQNVDSATSFRWQIEKSNILISGIKVDSVSARDSNRFMFASNVSFNASHIKLKTTDGLYSLLANEVAYASASQWMEIKQLEFTPLVNEAAFSRHFGYQHEIYKLKAPLVRLKNFVFPLWITRNRMQADTLELASPVFAIHLDRNGKANPYSRKGKYPQQMLQRAGFTIAVKRVNATDASVTYTETSNLTNKTGKLVFPSLSGTIDNITNDPVILKRSPECIARIHGSIMSTGKLNTVFHFNLPDPAGAFTVNTSISHLDAPQLQPLFKAMTAVEMQSFNMQQLDCIVTGNENAATSSLSMRYDNMDILLNKVEPDKSLDRKGLLSLFANRLIIYKENPMKDEEERKANGMTVQRDFTKSFFSLVWKTMLTALSKIVLRPLGQRKVQRMSAPKN
ncbi:MAG: hypothetical protein ABIT05_16685 [Chitinophagaceae bacterium]